MVTAYSSRPLRGKRTVPGAAPTWAVEDAGASAAAVLALPDVSARPGRAVSAAAGPAVGAGAPATVAAGSGASAGTAVDGAAVVGPAAAVPVSAIGGGGRTGRDGTAAGAGGSSGRGPASALGGGSNRTAMRGGNGAAGSSAGAPRCTGPTARVSRCTATEAASAQAKPRRGHRAAIRFTGRRSAPAPGRTSCRWVRSPGCAPGSSRAQLPARRRLRCRPSRAAG